jgi:hypothetical protein
MADKSNIWIWDQLKENCFKLEDIKLISIEKFDNAHEDRKVIVQLENGKVFILNSFSNKINAINFAETLFGEENYVRSR